MISPFNECNMADYKRALLPGIMGVTIFHTFKGWRMKYPNDSKYRQYKFQMAHYPTNYRDPLLPF